MPKKIHHCIRTTFEEEKKKYIMPTTPSKPIKIPYTKQELAARAALAERTAEAKKETKRLKSRMKAKGIQTRTYSSDSN